MFGSVPKSFVSAKVLKVLKMLKQFIEHLPRLTAWALILCGWQLPPPRRLIDCLCGYKRRDRIWRSAPSAVRRFGVELR